MVQLSRSKPSNPIAERMRPEILEFLRRAESLDMADYEIARRVKASPQTIMLHWEYMFAEADRKQSEEYYREFGNRADTRVCITDNEHDGKVEEEIVMLLGTMALKRLMPNPCGCWRRGRKIG